MGLGPRGSQGWCLPVGGWAGSYHGRVQAAVVLGLVSACWWIELCPRVAVGSGHLKVASGYVPAWLVAWPENLGSGSDRLVAEAGSQC